MPNTTASMITAPSTALGRSENSGARTSRVARRAPGHERGDRRPRARRLVQRAGREARRDRHALEHAGADVRHPLGDGLLVDVDAVAVARGERPGVARGLGEPDQQQRDGRDGDRREWSPTSASIGSSGAGSPRGTSPTSATPCAPRSNSAEASRPPATSTSAPGTAGREPAQAEDDAERGDADEHRRPVHVAERPQPGRELAPRVVALGRRAGELRQLPDDDVDGGSGEEARDHRLREEAARSSPSGAARAAGTAVRSRARSPRPAAPPRRPPRPVTTTAPPATAASDELGPVEMCRDVQKSA